MNDTAPVMADVARLAGVSLQTVSRVVNDVPHVSGPTRAKVVAAMDQLGYRRNAIARALATRRSGVVGVITFHTTMHGPISILYAVERAASALGLGVTFTAVEEMSPAAVIRALRRLQDQAVEGVIALAPHRDAVPVLTETLRSVPTVLVGAIPEHLHGASPTLSAIGLDQHGGAAAATRHLLELGHRTVHHLAGPQEWLSARRRVDGWRATLTATGVTPPTPREGDWTARSGRSTMLAVLQTDPDLTAVFAANDQMALGAISALTGTGRRVPEDVSIVGFDDTPEAEFYRPALTTVRQGFTEAGERAVHQLLALIRPDEAGAPAAPAAVVPAELVVRASTGPPA